MVGGAQLGQDTSWTEVIRKKKRQVQGESGKLDVATTAWKVSHKDTFSFYFSKFPETHGAKEMLKAFRFYGEAMEVVIPPKRDKWGRRFGFVRFSNVGDPRVFAVKLDNIIFGATKIHVNVPRFQRVRNGGSNPHQQMKQTAVKQQQKQVAIQQDYQAVKQQEHPQKYKQKSHRVQVWRKKETGEGGARKLESHVQYNSRWKVNQNDKPEVQKIIYHRKNNISEVCYTVPEEEMQKFRKMYVGTVKIPGSTYYIHEWFGM